MRLVVVGGGAAGFFCAIRAAELNSQLEVIIVERTNKLLSKVRISGGGRCNVTHACFSIPDMIRKYPRGSNFVKKTFHRFFTTDTIRWFEERGVPVSRENDGRMFPASNDSESIVRCLTSEATKNGVRIWMKKEVISASPADKGWNLTLSSTDDSAPVYTDYLCIATGGFPKSSQFDWLRHIGHTIVPPVPSLFTFNLPDNPIVELMGISVHARIRIRALKLEEEGPVLITHWGLSGPAVLKLSARGARELSALNYQFIVQVNWSPGYSDNSLREKFQDLRVNHASRKVVGSNDLGIPMRLWLHFCTISSILDHETWAELTALKANRLVRNITAQDLQVSGRTTFKEEFVTAGGVKLSEINPGTMESRILAGVFFAGEVMDVDGITGGFNFQHAWTSGWIAGDSIGEASRLTSEWQSPTVV